MKDQFSIQLFWDLADKNDGDVDDAFDIQSRKCPKEFHWSIDVMSFGRPVPWEYR